MHSDLKKSREQLILTEQQLRATNQQLELANQQLIARERELKKEKQFSEKIIETAHAIIVGLDKNHCIKIFNNGAEQITGYKKEEVIGKDGFELFFPNEKLDEMNKIWFEAWGNKFNSYDNLIITKSGEERIISWQNTGIYDSDNELNHLMISIGEDITEHRRAEEALARNEGKYRLLAKNTMDTIWTSDLHSNMTYVNKAIFKLLGYTPEEVLGDSIAKFMSPAGMIDIEQAADSLLLLHKNGERVQKEVQVQHIRKDGEIIDVRVTINLLLNSSGQVIGFQGRTIDITKHKQAEEALKQSQENLSNFFNTISKFIWVLDNEGNIITVNKTVIKRLGYTENELKGKSVLMVHPPEHRKEAGEIVHDMLMGKKDFCPIPIMDKQGIQIPVETRIEKGKWNGQPALFGVSKDISELKLSEEKFLKAFHLSPAISGISELETGKYIEVNQAFCDILGFEKSEVIGKVAGDVGKMDGEFKKAALKKLGTIGSIRNEETIIYTRQGIPKNVLLSAEIITIRDKKFNYTIALDITARKQAERELIEAKEKAEESELQFRNLFENAADAMFIAEEENGKIVDVNRAAEKLMQMERDTLIGWHQSKLHPQKELDYAINTFQIHKKQLQTLNSTDSVDNSIIRKNGTLVPVEILATKVVYRGEKCIVGTFRDITERKRAEQSILEAKEKAEENEKRFKLLNRLTSEMLLLQDVESIYDFITQTLHHHCPNTIVLTVSIDEPAQQTKLEAVAGLDNKLLTKAIELSGFNPIGKTYKLSSRHKEYFKSGHLIEFEHGLYEFSAGEVRALAAKSIEKLLGLHKIYTIGINKDEELLAAVHFFTYKKQEIVDTNFFEVFIKQAGLVLQKKINEKALKSAKEKAEESDRLKSAFLANMSHEIRTPMNGILGFTSLLKEPQLTGETKNQYINIIEKSGKRMLDTINDIVDISKLEAGQVEVVNTEISVTQILSEQFNFFLPEAKSKGLELIYIPMLSATDADIITDKHKLEGILTNLIKNAIKYTEKGRITLGCSIQKENKTDVLEFSVKDTGIGIPSNRIEAIFNRFEQADIEDTRVYEGSGLGLTISKSYVEMLGGKIWVSSKVGEGSSFFFRIPRILPQNTLRKSHMSREKEQQSSFKKLSLIVAEDDETSLRLFKAIFKSIFKNIIYAKTGQETISQLRENPNTDIILMDINMPGMNGYNATREIRKFNRDVIIIAQTAYGLSGDREKAIDAGCNDYITKPIKKEELFDKMRILLDEKSS